MSKHGELPERYLRRAYPGSVFHMIEGGNGALTYLVQRQGQGRKLVVLWFVPDPGQEQLGEAEKVGHFRVTEEPVGPVQILITPKRAAITQLGFTTLRFSIYNFTSHKFTARFTGVRYSDPGQRYRLLFDDERAAKVTPTPPGTVTVEPFTGQHFEVNASMPNFDRRHPSAQWRTATFLLRTSSAEAPVLSVPVEYRYDAKEGD